MWKLFLAYLASLNETFLFMKLLLGFFNLFGHLFNLDHVAVTLVPINRDGAHLQEHCQVFVVDLASPLGLLSLPHSLLGGKVAQSV